MGRAVLRRWFLAFDNLCFEHFSSYFAAYEVTKKMLTPAGQSPSDLNLSATIVAGGMAGVAMWSIAIPPDVS